MWTKTSESLVGRLASSAAEVEEAQRLRYRIFAEERGARLSGLRPGHDVDRFDRFCDHLLVRDRGTGELVATTRLLSDVGAVKAGGFYSETEFELGAVLAIPGRHLEVGRTCVAPGYRTGATIAALWQGVARVLADRRFDYLMGCASIELGDGGYGAQRIFGQLRRRHLSPAPLRVKPKQSWSGPAYLRDAEPVSMPPLLKAYMRLGAWVCGDLAYDPEFNTADVFILLPARRIEPRYARHFLGRAAA